MKERLDQLARDVGHKVIAWRRHLHANPELSFEEHKTGQFIVEQLQALEGIEISRPSGTSVVGRLRGALPGPTIAIRADFDALPIDEETGLPFASRNPGVMHACGHDGHTAILLSGPALPPQTGAVHKPGQERHGRKTDGDDDQTHVFHLDEMLGTAQPPAARDHGRHPLDIGALRKLDIVLQHQRNPDG